jgi:uncharacterized protein YecA (UPF0149 family)
MLTIVPAWPVVVRESHRHAAGRAAAEDRLTRGLRVGRNEPCPCGSGKKYKRCCLSDAPR